MDNPEKQCLAFAASLELEPGNGELFFGRAGGFPVGLKFIDPAGVALLLFQVRHLLSADAPALRAVVYSAEVNQLLADKEVEIEFEDKMVWVTFAHGRRWLEKGTGRDLFLSILESFARAGLRQTQPETCHYCRQQPVPKVSCIEDKVVQICPACLEERSSRLRQNTPDATAGAVPLLLTSPFMMGVGALLWVGIWELYDRVFDLLHTTSVEIPHLVIGLMILGMGFLVGGPIGWCIRQSQRRGSAISVSMAVICSVVSVCAGEVLSLVWAIYREFKAVSFSFAFAIMPDYYLHNNTMFLVLKAGVALTGIFIAYEMSKPKKLKMDV